MMSSNRLKVLLIVEQCNPDWASVPLEGYRYFHEISQLADVTLVTHSRNYPALQQQILSGEVVYMPESRFSQQYYQLVHRLAYQTQVIWPLYHVLTYPIYAEFNRNVYRQFQQRILKREFDIVHALTPMLPRYPVQVIRACQTVPFILGPVNGGVPFPEGFQEQAKKEFVGLNFLRTLGRLLLPGYTETYRLADRVLAGSTFTFNLLKSLFQLPSNRLSLFYENGVLNCICPTQKSVEASSEPVCVNLLFVGRLVPYKCANILLDAIDLLPPSVQQRLKVTIVGEGPERAALEAQTRALRLTDQVHFTGWVNQADIQQYYCQADIFCFPSIREFGGAVVLEAMICGLPCIVANNGGIGEYVTAETGFKIEPLSPEYLTRELAKRVQQLIEDPDLRRSLSAGAIKRAQEFTWPQKAKQIVEIYQEVLIQKTNQIREKSSIEMLETSEGAAVGPALGISTNS